MVTISFRPSVGTDIVDNGTSYELTADLPGFKKEEISVDINGDRLTISAEHKEDTNGDEKNYIHRERRYGTLRRSFDISGIQADQFRPDIQTAFFI